MEVKDIIKNRRLQMGLTMKQLAQKIGVSEGTISRWESGEISNMKRDKVSSLSVVMDIPPEVIMGWKTQYNEVYDAIQETLKSIPENIQPISTQTLPVLGEIACGQPKFMDEGYEVYTSGRTSVKADFILKAKGDSMIGARIYDGDLVFVRQQPEVENGEIAVVAIDDEATLKRFYKYDNLIVLRPENPDYEEMQYGPDSDCEIRVLGKAIAFQSNIR